MTINIMNNTKDNLMIFENEEFRLSVRMMKNPNGSICVNAEDAAKGLGWTTVAKSGNVVVRWARMNKYCKEIGYEHLCTKDTYIPESLFYRLAMKANNANAEKFQNWIAIDVVPTIRETGSYQMKAPQGKELLALAVLEAQKTIEELNSQVERMKPKEIFADAVASSKQSILIGQLAKLICQNGYSIGQNRLFQWMRNNGYLMKSGNNYNMPMQKYVEQGLFEIKERTMTNPDGSVRLTRTTKVTGKGQQYFINKFLKDVS